MSRDSSAGYEVITEALTKKIFLLKNKDYVPRPFDLNDLDGQDDEQKVLRNIKVKVGEKCSQVGHSNWRSHTTFTHPLKGLPTKLAADFPLMKPSITQAYCKFVEILHSNPDLFIGHRENGDEDFRSFHMCEAPGNFVRALGDYLPEQEFQHWTWRMNSLNPYYEGADLKNLLFDDTFMIRHMDKMVFGADNTGNVSTFSEEYVSNVVGDCGKFHLITCDGSFDCRDIPTEQEKALFSLFTQCWRVANKCLSRHGCMVMKIYTFFTDEMQNLLAQISACFTKVLFQKPSCSKPGNSEVYLVCIGFQEQPFNTVSDSWASRIQPALKFAAKFFSQHQCDMINFNLKTFGRLSPHERIAIEIRKNNLIMESSHRLFGFLPQAEQRREKTELYRGFDLNPWLRSAWLGVNVKDSAASEYFSSVAKSRDFPRIVPTAWDELPSVEDMICSIPKVECLSRHPAVTVCHRSNRTHSPDSAPNLISSLFADYKAYTDMCKKNPKAFRKLKTEFVQEYDGIYVDSAFMSKTAWLELCILAACGSSLESKYPRQSNLVQLVDDGPGQTVDRIHIYLNYGHSLVLTRFAGSVVYFLAHFFEKMALDQKGIHFLERKRVSPPLATYLTELSVGLPDSYDLLQFVPSLAFASSNIYHELLDYNNNALIYATNVLQDKFTFHSSQG